MTDKSEDLTPDGIPLTVNGQPLSPQQITALREARARMNRSEKPELEKEINGPAGPEPTRYGDWEKKGRVSDF